MTPHLALDMDKKMNATMNGPTGMRRGWLPAFAVALGLMGAGCPAAEGDPPPTDAGSVEECPTGTVDCACNLDGTCATDLACEGAVCVDCIWGSTDCPCLASGGCGPDSVCDDAERTCRAPTLCENAGCAQHQLCSAAAGGDAVCSAACEPGYDFDASTVSCTATPTCTAGAPGTLTCGPGLQCVEDAQGARCEACQAGFVGFDGVCVPDTSCAAYCGPGRDCVLPTADFPAECRNCDAGFVLDDVADRCVDRITCSERSCGATEVCLEATAEADATCVDNGACPLGQVETSGGACVACVDCYDGDLPLPGVIGVGNGGIAAGSRCVCELEPGFFQSSDNGEVTVCDADGDGWVNQDLVAVLALNGGSNAFAAEQRCTVREVSQFELTADVASLPGARNRSTRVVTVSDLVVRHSLPPASVRRDGAGRSFIQLFEPEAIDVPELFLRRYDALDPAARLRNYGGAATEPATAGLSPHRLTAAEVNPLTKWCNHDKDDLNLDSIADVVQSHDKLPQTLASTTLEATPVLYRMSYFLELDRGFWRDRTADCGVDEAPCHGAYVIREKSRAAGPGEADGFELTYVDRSTNGLAANHWQQCARSRDPDYDGVGGSTQNMDFATWSEDCVTQTGSCLVETTIGGGARTSAHVAYDGRTVRNNGTVGNKTVDDGDVAGVERWPGMNHHSQFKCVSASTTLPAGERERALDPDVDYDLNTCTLDPRIVQTVAAGVDVVNPRDPVLACTPSANAPLPVSEFNRWAALVPSSDIAATQASGYAGGCAVEGAEWSHLCAASSSDGSESAALNNVAASFGQLFCACGPNRSGAFCEVGCPDEQIFSNDVAGESPVEVVDGQFVNARRWVCAHPTAMPATFSADATASLSGPGGALVITPAYQLLAEVPGAIVTPRLQGSGNGTTYTLTAPPVR